MYKNEGDDQKGVLDAYCNIDRSPLFPRIQLAYSQRF